MVTLTARLVGPQALLLAWLHGTAGAGWATLPPMSGWAVADQVDLAAAIIRLLALGLGWWGLATTVLTLLVHAGTDAAPTRRRVLGLVPPGLRGVIRRAVAGATLSGALLGQSMALAAPLPPGLDPGSVLPVPAATTVDEPATPLLPPGLDGGVTQPSPVDHDSWRDGVGAVPVATNGTTSPGVHVVAPGEHLWSVARAQLAAADLPTDDATVAAHWRRLVEVNLPDLPSGDPDLVHAGQHLVLPPVVAP